MSDAQSRPRRVSVVGLLVVGAVTLFGAFLVFGGVRMLVERQTGERAEATVTNCVDSGPARNRRTHCVGTWRSASGEVRTGTIQGATSGQEGETISVTIEGDRAYARGMALPLMLAGLGLVPLGLGLLLLRGMVMGPAPAAPGESPA